MNEVEPAAIVQNTTQQAVDLIFQAKAVDDRMKASIRTTADDMVERGKILIRAKQLVGKGEPWREVLQKVGWNVRTAYRYMAQATEKARCDMVSQFESHTHPFESDKGGEEDSSELVPEVIIEGPAEEDEPSLTPAQRKTFTWLIGTVRPKLAKKLRDGSKTMTDDELRKALPPSCERCMRGIFPGGGRPCENCAALRAAKRTRLFEEGEEPEDDRGPDSPPKPPADPFEALKKMTTLLATTVTKAITDDGEEARRLHDYLSWCGLVDHPKEGEAKFIPLAGVKKIMELAGRSRPMTEAAVKLEYEKACGAVPWIPPAVKFRRSQKGRK